jgi:hypothetical protein
MHWRKKALYFHSDTEGMLVRSNALYLQIDPERPRCFGAGAVSVEDEVGVHPWRWADGRVGNTSADGPRGEGDTNGRLNVQVHMVGTWGQKGYSEGERGRRWRILGLLRTECAKFVMIETVCSITNLIIMWPKI